MSGTIRIAMAVATVALLAFPPLMVHGPALGHDQSGHGTAEGIPEAAHGSGAAAKVRLLDVALIDKDGRTMRFEREAVGERIVAIDFVYTTCTTICPILSAIMAQVQDQMAGHLGEEVRLISISIDPTRDTPRRLADYAKKFDAGPHWVWLTGRKSTVDEVLIELGAYTPDYIDHPPMLVIGDAKRGDWSRLIGLPSPDDVVARLQALLDARQSTKTSLKSGD